MIAQAPPDAPALPPLPPGVMIALIALIALAAVLVLAPWLRRRFGRGEVLPYRPVDSLLTPAEQAFYRVLADAIADVPVAILAKVRLADLLVIPRGTDAHQRHRGRVQAKHVDFVLADLETLRPLLVIELDDATHRRRDRAERDAFVDAVMRTVGLPIWHVPCSGTYSQSDLREGVLGRMGHP